MKAIRRIAVHKVADPLRPRLQGGSPNIAGKLAAKRQRHGLAFLPALVPGG
jgi:hypothetical protein